MLLQTKLFHKAAKSGFYELGPWGKGLAASLRRHDRSALSLGLTKQGIHGSAWTAQITGGAVDNQLALDYSIKVLNGLKVKVGTTLGVGEGGAIGITAFLTGERQVTETTRCGMGITAALPGGITVRFK
jgi:hypothetical protein